MPSNWTSLPDDLIAGYHIVDNAFNSAFNTKRMMAHALQEVQKIVDAKNQKE